jgi:aerobic carbon-monoxide dehydrogenase medium subunit
MKARAFVYRRPRDLAEAVALLADHAGEAQILAGGQSLIPTLNMRLSSPGMLVDINRIDALRGIEERGGSIRVGALVRHAEVLGSSLIAHRVPLLALAISHVAHAAVRNRGTTCGSLALADPAAEMPAVAVALNAGIVLERRGGQRTVTARNFFQGLYQTARSDEEMITEVVFPAAQPDEVFGFSEVSRRHGDFATVGVAVRARRSGRDLRDIEVVIFGSEPTPLLSTSTAGLALDGGASEAALAEIAHALAKDMKPIDSHQGRGETKRKHAAVLLTRVLKDMIAPPAQLPGSGT